MRTYNFIDINESPKYNKPRIMTVIDGKNLDVTIEGFETLNVTGREMVGREIQSRNYKSFSTGGTSRTKSSNNVGINKLISSNYPSRVLKVEYKLASESDRKARRNWEKMNYYINKEEVEIYFTDDSDYYYIGTLIGIDDVVPNVNTIISSFEFECMDPFKYRRIPQFFTFDTRADFMHIAMYPVRCEELIVKPRVTTNKLRVQNETNGLFIQLDHKVNALEEITFDLLNSTVKSSTGEDLTKDLYLLSYIEDFEVLREDTLSCNVPADCILKFRRKVL